MAHGQESIQSLLGGLLKDRRMLSSMRRVMVMTLWDQVVGDLVAQKSWPEKVNDGVLTIGVTSHTWADQLHLLKPQILSRYRQLLGRSILKDVEFHISRRRPQHEKPAEMGPALHPARGEKLNEGPVPNEVFAGVQNPEIRELLGPAFARLRAEREWKHEQGWVRCGTCRRVFHGQNCPHCGGRAEAC